MVSRCFWYYVTATAITHSMSDTIFAGFGLGTGFRLSLYFSKDFDSLEFKFHPLPESDFRNVVAAFSVSVSLISPYIN